MAVVELQAISRSFELGNTRVTALDKLDLTLEKANSWCFGE